MTAKAVPLDENEACIWLHLALLDGAIMLDDGTLEITRDDGAVLRIIGQVNGALRFEGEGATV